LPLALALDDEASVFRNGQHPVMVAVGRRCGATGRGHAIAF
jgi:hypothetical protein